MPNAANKTVMLTVTMLNIIKVSVFVLSVTVPSVSNKTVMLSVTVLNVNMRSVFMLSGIMLGVMAPICIDTYMSVVTEN